MPRRSLSSMLAVFALALITAPAVNADPAKCRAEISKASAKFVQARLKALTRCEDKVVRGKLPASTDCAAEEDTVAAIGKAAGRVSVAIDKRCGGDDRVCGSGGDDEALAAIGWTNRTCPDLEDRGCINQINHCGDIAACLTCIGAGATTQLAALAFDRIDLDSPPRSDLEKCQAEIGKATSRFAGIKVRALQSCWSKVDKGRATAPCPAPGDGKTAAKIAKADTKLISAICKRCGGDDDGCDGDVGGVTGTGGDDDFTPAAIGFVGNCADLTIPGAAATCAAPIGSLADLVECIRCISAFKTDCTDPAAVPWAASYPQQCTDLVYAEHFDGDDGAAWPAPWVPLDDDVETYDLQSNRARFRPEISGYSLARLYAPFNETDVDARFTFEFSDQSSQGIGFYARQNGGYLNQTFPAGQGYAVFIERFREDPGQAPDGTDDTGIGLWYEENGNEISLQIDYGVPPVQAGTRYRARFRVNQSGPNATILRAKMWPEADPEPGTWMIEHTDANPILQGIGGGFAIDAWSDHINPLDPAAYMFFDDVEIRRLRNPLTGIGAVTPIQETFAFAEGPRWRAADGVLLFSDITANTIYRLTPPSTVDVFRTPSDMSNGLANDVNGDLLAAEHGTRQISRTDSSAVVTTVVDTYLGDRFNSPNDIAVRSDGTIYFTDPHYGLANPGDREIAFNGLYRIPPGSAAVAEWQGDAVNDGPNGVVLSPDESVLYMSNSETGTVTAWDVAGDGALSNLRTFASGMTIPDGMCVDAAGNVYVATWASTIEVFSPEGDRWGSIPLPGTATNCTFGGSDRMTLYVTTQSALYRVQTVIPGVP